MLFTSQIQRYLDRMTSSPDARRVLGRIFELADVSRGYLDPHDNRKLADIAWWFLSEFRIPGSWATEIDENGLPKRISGVSSLDELWIIAEKALKANGGSFEMPHIVGDEEFVHAFEDNASVVRLATREAVLREVKRMNTSFRLEGVFGQDDFKEGKEAIWLLKAPDGGSLALMALNRIAICDVVGWNKFIPDMGIIKDYVMPLVREFDLWLMRPSAIPGMVQGRDGGIYDLHDLPDGLTVDDDLLLYDNFPDIRRLPDDLTVNGTFIISNNPHIEETPVKLRARDGIAFVDCRNLHTIRSGLVALGFSSFSGCSKLRNIERDVVFHEGVELPDNSDLLKCDFYCNGELLLGNKSIDPKLLFKVMGIKPMARAAQAIASAKSFVESLKSPVRYTKGRGSLASAIGEYANKRDATLQEFQDRMDAEIQTRSERSVPGIG